MGDLGKHFNIAFDFMPASVCFIDGSNRVLFANAAFKQFLLKQYVQLPHGSIEALFPDMHDMKEDGDYETVMLAGGAEMPVRVSLYSLSESCRIMIVHAESDSGEVQRNLHAQRIETLGMLAGGIAHDFNNILTGLLGHITYLRTILPAAGSHMVSLSALEEGARKASSMTQEILNFSRLEPDEKAESVNLTDLVSRTYNLLRGAISPEFDLQCRLPDFAVKVLAVEAKVAQVLVNLVMNSRDAITRGGFIRIDLNMVEDRNELESVFATKELTAKRYARLSVSDNGHGMSKEIQERAFDPYYSTKKGKGTGLGLSIVNEVVKQFAGAICIDSTVGQGTVISFYLPIVEELSSEETAPDREASSDIRGGSEHILVVDDEYPVRNVLYLSLEHLGYKVEIASSGAEALEMYDKSPSKFDLVILDMLMPHLSGDQTFFRLKALDPDVKVLVISGFASKEAVNSILDNGGLGFVQKPFTIAELAKIVRQCLAAG